MTTEITKTEEKAIATPFDHEEMGSSSIDSSDIQIPRLHLLQGLSEGVATGDFKMGDILHTADQEVLGGIKNPLKIIPFHMSKVNQKFRTDINPKEYVLTEDWHPDLDWEEENYVWEKNDGTSITCKVNNFKTYIMHAVVVDDNIDFSLPISITFRSSAGKDGQKIASHFATVMQFNKARPDAQQPPYNVVWDLSSDLVKGDKTSYAKWSCKRDRKTTDEERTICAQWAKAISANSRKYTSQAGESEVIRPNEGQMSQVSTPKTVKNFAPTKDDLKKDEIPF